MQLTKTIFQNSAIFIEKKWGRKSIVWKSGFLLEKKCIILPFLLSPTLHCFPSLTSPEAKQRPVIAPRNTWYDRPDPPP